MSVRPPLILASGSPRRRELLQQIGLSFTVQPVDIDESLLPGEDPEVYVLRLAQEKAAAGVERVPGTLVLAADTTVTVDGDVLGKPRDEVDAHRMLDRLQGREHRVMTGVCLVDGRPERTASTVVTSRVRFAPMESREIDWYVRTGEPMDKAGAYAIQGLGALFVEELEGNYPNVVGLPLPAVRQLFRELGHPLLDDAI